jgi:mitotic spindle assembly checkpoint protein MAD1
MELNGLRERHASVEVLREEKRGLERKVKVLEELREKVVKLEAEVEAGRREREEWAKKSAESPTSTPSKTPIALTQSLSALRLTHARLLEDHGSTKALLRQREAEITTFEQRESEAQHMVDDLHAEVRGLREKVERSARKTALAEREVGFLQALVVNFSPPFYIR